MVIEVTIRTIQGRHLLRSSDEINEIILGILGRAQKKYGIRIHVFVFMSNHYHLIITIPDAEALAEFENYLNGNLAREAGRLHGWRDKFWSRRYTAIPILDDVAMEARASYVLSNGCKEGLVETPRDWPGVTSLQSMLTGEASRGFWFNRTAEWHNRRRRNPATDKYAFATPYEVELAPLPCWENLDDEAYHAKVRTLVERIEQATREKNRETDHVPPGREWVLAQGPHTHPETPHRSPAPPCHTSSWSLRKEFLSAYYAFVDLYVEASTRFRSGKLDTPFPADCFRPPLPFTGLVDSRAPP
jgi:REP element-mobilizing transposase RayT